MDPLRVSWVMGVLLTLPARTGEAAETRVGLSLDYSEVMTFCDRSRVSFAEHYDAVGASAVADFKYLRLATRYATNLGDYIIFTGGKEEHDDGYRIRYLSLIALGKYPWYFARGKLALWPAMGIEGAMNLEYLHRGSTQREINHKPHDLLWLAGGGMDFEVSSRFVLSGWLALAYNLTPSMGGDARGAQGIAATLSLGALMRL